MIAAIIKYAQMLICWDSFCLNVLLFIFCLCAQMIDKTESLLIQNHFNAPGLSSSCFIATQPNKNRPVTQFCFSCQQFKNRPLEHSHKQAGVFAWAGVYVCSVSRSIIAHTLVVADSNLMCYFNTHMWILKSLWGSDTHTHTHERQTLTVEPQHTHTRR